MSTAIQQHSDKGKSTGITKTDRESAKQIPAVARVAPWVDLPAKADLQKEPREKTVLACALKLLRERGRDGATLVEIKESFRSIEMFHHDPKALLTWASKNRGWGFHMKQGTDRIVLVTK